MKGRVDVETSRFIAALLAAILWCAFVPAPAHAQALLRVPGDFEDIQSAIDVSEPGDIILVDKGTYPGGLEVGSEHSGITIRGVDRNEVVLDGGDDTETAIEVTADDVAIENLTAHNFTGTAFKWDGVDGLVARYLTAYRVGGFGIHIHQSRKALVEEAYVSGAGRAAFGLEGCDPCDVEFNRLTARYAETGLLVLDARGQISVRGSLFEYNGAGILLSTFGLTKGIHQASAIVANNTIKDNGTEPTPSASEFGGFAGIGIGIAGGSQNTIRENEVRGNAGYGIVLWSIEQANGRRRITARNEIFDNEVGRNKRADLAAAVQLGPKNCFARNGSTRTRPALIEDLFPCAVVAPTPTGTATGTATPTPTPTPTVEPSPAATLAPGGDRKVSRDLPRTLEEAAANKGDHPSYELMAAAEPQPTLPGAADTGGLPPRREAPEPSRALTWIAIVVVALTIGGLVFLRTLAG
ncbi:MAG TPA: NosD domain-containing protein [Actinomycetota bacterium]|nr:NosD domain-containing protein [Actinomycetota bacterium]